MPSTGSLRPQRDRTVTHGAEELLDREQDCDETTSDLAILDGLITAVTNRRDALPV